MQTRLAFFAALLFILTLSFQPEHVFQHAFQIVYAQSEKASISGFAITPSKVEAYVPQGYAAKAIVKVIGLNPTNLYIKWLGGSRDGVNVTISEVHKIGDTTLITVNIFAYRPGFYKYGLYIGLSPTVSSKGGVKAVPVVVVPIYVVVPGVRVSLINLNTNMTSRTVTICIGLVPYFFHREQALVKGYKTSITAILDNKIVERKTMFIERGTRKCFHLGPFKPHTIHTFIVTAEVNNVSRDGIHVKFAVGKIIVKISLVAKVHNPHIIFFGGIVGASYTLHLETNSSSCLIDLEARIGKMSKKKLYNIKGEIGTMQHYSFSDTISGYIAPQILIPITIVPLHLHATARCIGVQRYVTTDTHSVLLVIDLTPLVIYALVAAVVYVVLRIRKRRKRRKKSSVNENE